MEVRRMRPKPKISALDKKIKPNPRYQNVETVINTGNNLRKELERLEEVQQFYKFRHDEVFRRVNINSLVRLVTEVTKLEYQLNPPPTTSRELQINPDDSNSDFNDSYIEELEVERDNIKNDNVDELDEDIGSIIQSQFDPVMINRASSLASRQTVRSVASLLQGVGEMDNHQEPEVDTKPDRPFLLLDVRDPEKFSRSHLIYSVNYPHTRLNRAFDYELSDMIRLKNKEKRIIVLYDDDESLASKCTSTLTQRGYDNVFMLSGGMRVAQLKYPESFVVSDDSTSRLEEGDVIVLERQLEENIMTGSSSRLSKGGSSARSVARSISLDRGSVGSRFKGMDAPIRTSTAMKNRF